MKYDKNSKYGKVYNILDTAIKLTWKSKYNIVFSPTTPFEYSVKIYIGRQQGLTYNMIYWLEKNLSPTERAVYLTSSTSIAQNLSYINISKDIIFKSIHAYSSIRGINFQYLIIDNASTYDIQLISDAVYECQRQNSLLIQIG